MGHLGEEEEGFELVILRRESITDRECGKGGEVVNKGGRYTKT